MPKDTTKVTAKPRGASKRVKTTRATCGLCALSRAQCACSAPALSVDTSQPRPLPRVVGAARPVASATDADRAAVTAAERHFTSAAGTAAEIGSSGRSSSGEEDSMRARSRLILPTSLQSNSFASVQTVTSVASSRPPDFPNLDFNHENLDPNINTSMSPSSLFPSAPLAFQTAARQASAVELLAAQSGEIASQPTNQEDEEEEGDTAEADDDEGEDLDAGVNEKACRQLWLSTADALAEIKTNSKWAYVTDEKKRQRVIREKYWRLVKQACIFANRTGVHVLLAAGRTERVSRGLKEHIFASEELCRSANKCLNDTANTIADTWTKGMAAYRELQIARNKEQEALLRQHQAQFLADQQRIKEQDEALKASLANAAALQEELDRLRATATSSTAEATLPS